ncbi:MAG: hypothetical protein LBK42_05710 [Propionibacteriaceae bacterium]|jgi:hypothetical protein|nr:hypothetical protein [Propionibacteriaceae bacterium]
MRKRTRRPQTRVPGAGAGSTATARRILLGLLVAAMTVGAVAGCSVTAEGPIEATATISAALDQGTLYRLSETTEIRLGATKGAYIEFVGIDRDEDNQPRAHLKIAATEDVDFRVDGYLRLGESLSVPDIGVFTLVSFDNSFGGQRVTVLLIREP